MNILIVGAGGFIGVALRYMIGLVPVSENTAFPVKTFAINVIGCLAIGLITVLALKNTRINPGWILFLKTGLCGGFTTFSTFALETTGLIKGGHTGIAFLYAFLSLIIGCGVIFGIEMVMSK